MEIFNNKNLYIELYNPFSQIARQLDFRMQFAVCNSGFNSQLHSIMHSIIVVLRGETTTHVKIYSLVLEIRSLWSSVKRKNNITCTKRKAIGTNRIYFLSFDYGVPRCCHIEGPMYYDKKSTQ